MRHLFFLLGLLIVLLGLAVSCRVQVNTETVEKKSHEADFKQDGNSRKWSILIYMSADNNLESEALSDICEMEMSKLNTDEVSVLMLVDRSAGYDTSNGNWTGGKFYELKTGRKSSEISMISEEITCESLGLFAGSDTELNMASGFVLTEALKFMKAQYTADFYGLIIWGHGTGWRNQEYNLVEQEELKAEAFKAFAFDSSSNEYMSLIQLQQGIKNADICLDFLGFDTCFGGELEIFYQLKNDVKYAVGSEGLVVSSGWNYESLLNEFNSLDKTPEQLCSCTVNQFKQQYSHKSGASVCAVKCSEIETLFDSFEDFMETAATGIDSVLVRDNVINSIFTDSLLFSYGHSGSDVYIDSFSLINILSNSLKNSVTNIEESEASFNAALKECLVSYWAYDALEIGPGVYLGVLAESGLLSGIHPAAYIKGKNSDQIDFVSDSKWYVPAKITGDSLLDKLFYKNNWE